MKNSNSMVDVLNAQLAEELISISQTLVYKAVCKNWGYRGLQHVLRSVARSEKKHVAHLTGRIMSLEGKPQVSSALSVRLGADVNELLSQLLEDGTRRIGSYSQTLKLAADLDDQKTYKMIARIIQEEQNHIDWASVQLGLIRQMGLEIYQASVIARQIRPHMQVYAGGEPPAVLIGTVKGVYRHRYIKLHRRDADDHQRRYLPLEWAEFIEGDVVRLSKGAGAVHTGWLLKAATRRAAQETSREVSAVT